MSRNIVQDMTEDDAARAGAKAGIGLYNTVTLVAQLATILLEPVRHTADRLTVRALHRDAETLTRRAARIDG